MWLSASPGSEVRLGGMAVRYLFENYTFDSDRRELRRGAEMVPVAPQVFDLLDYLIRNRERVVSKDDLIHAIWNGRAVSDAALTTRINAARGAIGDTGEKQHLIKTLPRKGFRFIGAVQEDRQRPVEQTGSAAFDAIAETAPSAPCLSIVVLPFANIGGDPAQDYFSDGVTDSLTTDLSRISDAFVIASSTAFTMKSRAVDVKRIGRELNVRYVLEGSVQRDDRRLRVNVQLIDAETGNHLWAERFDKPLTDLFDMQDEIVSRLANALDAQLVAAEARRAQRSLHPDARDFCFQGMAWIHKGMTNQQMAQARGFFKQALALDPDYIEALVGGAVIDLNEGANFATDERAVPLAAAETALVRALSMAPGHARAHLYLGAVQIFTGRVAQGIAECEQALALDRNLADAHGWIGLGKYFLGRAEETEAHIREALRLSPSDVFAFRWLLRVGMAKVQLNEGIEALAWFRRSIEANRNFPLAHFHVASALAQLGSLDEARAAAQAGLALDPGFTLRRFRAGTTGDNPRYLARREWTLEGLRIAGVPKG